MAGFGGGASSTGNMADSAVSDAKQMAKTAADVYNAGREAQKDAKAVSKAAGQIASGNYVGAVTTAIKNPKTTLKIILVALVLFMIPFFITMMGVIFVVQLPGSIAESVQSAVGQSVDSVTLGWEDFKARLSAGVDDFLTFATTGQFGDASKSYRDDLAIADDPVFYGYTSTSNVMVAVLNHYFKDAYARNYFVPTNTLGVELLSRTVTLTRDDLNQMIEMWLSEMTNTHTCVDAREYTEAYIDDDNEKTLIFPIIELEELVYQKAGREKYHIVCERGTQDGISRTMGNKVIDFKDMNNEPMPAHKYDDAGIRRDGINPLTHSGYWEEEP